MPWKSKQNPNAHKRSARFSWSFRSTVSSLWLFQSADGGRIHSPFSSRRSAYSDGTWDDSDNVRARKKHQSFLTDALLMNYSKFLFPTFQQYENDQSVKILIPENNLCKRYSSNGRYSAMVKPTIFEHL